MRKDIRELLDRIDERRTTLFALVDKHPEIATLLDRLAYDLVLLTINLEPILKGPADDTE